MPEVLVELALDAPAKMNWSLQVLGRRADSFHELRSWFVALDWTDRLRLTAASQGQNSMLEVEGSNAVGVPTDSRNLILKAEQAWRQAGGSCPPTQWKLTKEIPHGAGLGGGSSDAAAALRLLQAFAARSGGCGLLESTLSDLAATLGSDLSFFLDGSGAEYRGGRGERLLSRSAIPTLDLLLVCPRISLSTPRVFAEVHAPSWPPSVDADTGTEQAEPFPRCPGPNDLEEAAFRISPPLKEVAGALRRHAPAVMSGSGSSFFFACKSEQQAAALHRELIREPVLQGAQMRLCHSSPGPVLGQVWESPEARG